MNLFSKVSLVIALLLLVAGASFGQKSRKALEQKKSSLKKEIDYKNKLLRETKKSKKLSLNQLTLYRKKIANREALINTLKQEVNFIDQQIENTHLDIRDKENELAMLKEEYAKMIYHAFKTKSSYHKLMFVFASENFNQAYKRLKYLQQYSDFRKRQAEMIVETQNELNAKIEELEQKKNKKENVIQSKKEENQNLDKDRAEKQKVFNELNSKEKELKNEIKKKQKESEKLQKAIQRIITEEIKKQAKNNKGKFVLTPESQALSANFESNKGKLPWPTAKGIVTEYYGKHQHPELRGIYINNNGIDISTEKDATARSVFSGVVSGVIVLPGMGKAIMIRHGEYISVYSNLSDVFVQKGESVDLKQSIGKARTDASKGVTEVHFELWKGQTTLNPSGWLYKFK